MDYATHREVLLPTATSKSLPGYKIIAFTVDTNANILLVCLKFTCTTGPSTVHH